MSTPRTVSPVSHRRIWAGRSVAYHLWSPPCLSRRAGSSRVSLPRRLPGLPVLLRLGLADSRRSHAWQPRMTLARWEPCGIPPPPPNPGLELVSAIPEICPPGEGMLCLDRVALGHVVPLRDADQRFSGWSGSSPAKTPVDVGQRWVVLGDAVCTLFVPGPQRVSPIQAMWPPTPR